jgi:hypothetical protein
VDGVPEPDAHGRGIRLVLTGTDTHLGKGLGITGIFLLPRELVKVMFDLGSLEDMRRLDGLGNVLGNGGMMLRLRSERRLWPGVLTGGNPVVDLAQADEVSIHLRVLERHTGTVLVPP